MHCMQVQKATPSKPCREEYAHPDTCKDGDSREAQWHKVAQRQLRAQRCRRPVQRRLQRLRNLAACSELVFQPDSLHAVPGAARHGPDVPAMTLCRANSPCAPLRSAAAPFLGWADAFRPAASSPSSSGTWSCFHSCRYLYACVEEATQRYSWRQIEQPGQHILCLKGTYLLQALVMVRSPVLLLVLVQQTLQVCHLAEQVRP